MNKSDVEYGNYLTLLYKAQLNKDGRYEPSYKCPDITFQINSDCNHRCSYCYEHHKAKEVMTLDMGKAIVDQMIKMWEEDKPGSLIRKDTIGMVLNFIGGEPLLYPELIDGILSYFIHRCEEVGCPLLFTTRGNITTNGYNFLDERVQHLVRKYQNMLTINITVDGPKEIHDKYRLTVDGGSSFDNALAAYYKAKEIYNKAQTKVTLVPRSFPNLFNTLKFMASLEPTQINCNYAYEPVYSYKDGRVLYEQLKKVSDWHIENKLDLYITLLHDPVGVPMDVNEHSNYCGGNGQMLCYAPNGNFYPCVRFAPLSIGEEASSRVILGDYKNGYLRTEEQKARYEDLHSITRQSQSNEKCVNCPVALGCGWCTANNYEITGSYNERWTGICNAHKARCLASAYFYNKRYLEIGDVEPKALYLPKEDALNFISEEEYNMLKALEEKAIITWLNLNVEELDPIVIEKICEAGNIYTLDAAEIRGVLRGRGVLV